MNRMLKSITVLLAAVCMFSISGCDDDPNVIGLNDSAKYGYIKLTFEGIRPDGDDFEQTKNYRFMTGSGPASSSSLDIYNDGGTFYNFHATRLLDAFDSNSNNFATVDITAEEQGGDLTITNAMVAFRSALTFKDNTAFNLSVSFGEIAPEDITSFNYNEETGKLVVKFKTVVEEDWNNSGSELTVKGEMKVKIFRSL